MVTKRTRLLSFFATILMLVSMLACIVIPASAESAELLALKAKYEALDPENFDGLEGDPIGAAIAQMEQYIAAFEENVDMQQEIIEAAAAYDAQLTATLNGKVKEGAEVRYALKGIYESYGYPMDATSYLISEVEDWKAAADSGNTFSGVTLKVTNNIDFTEAGNVDPLTMDEELFKGVLDGQGYKFIGMTVNVAGPSFWTGALVSALDVDAVIKNITLVGGSLTVSNVKNQGAVGDWPGVGSVAGHAERRAQILNVGSSMDITASVKDGKAGMAGIVGWGDSAYVVDNCFYTGTATNNGGPVSDFGYTGGSAGMKLYNSIGAGDLHATVTPVALYRCHVGYFNASLTGEQAGTANQLAFNSYAVGHDTVSLRDQATAPDALNATYFGETYTRANVNKAHAAADIKEAAWKVNSNFDNTKQAEQTYFMDVQDGELCFTTDADATLKRVLVEVGADVKVGYFHPGDTVNLVSDLGLGTGIDSVDGVEVNASFEFTMPGEDLELVVTYNDDEALAAAREALAEELEFFEGLDVEKAFVDAEGVQEWLDMTQDEELTSDPDIIAMIIEMKAELDLTFKSDYPVAYSKKGYYAESIPAGHTTFGIYEKGDWYALLDDYASTVCALKLYVMDDIYFNNEPMRPLAYVAHGLTGLLDGQGHTFYDININMQGAVANHYGVALVGALSAGGTIQNLTVTGNITNTSTNASALTAGFAAGKNNGGGSSIINCRSDLHVKGPSDSIFGLAMFRTYVQGDDVVKNCINNGTVESANNGGAAVFVPYKGGSMPTVKNNVDNGTLITSGAKAAVYAHGNWYASVNSNNWAVNNNAWYFNGALAAAVTLPDGTTASDAEAVNAYYTVGSAKEAAYKATAGANGEVFYTVEDGKVAFAEAKSVYKVAINGDDDLVGYYLAGETVDLIADLGLKEGIDSLTGYDYTADYKLTMPAQDLTLTVAYGDAAALVGAKEELNALIAEYAKYDLNLLENSTIGSWLEAANALAASEDLAAIRAQIAAADAITFGTLKEDAKVPYSKKALYIELLPDNNKTYGIYEKADWIQLTNDYATTSCALRIYVMNDIEFDPNENVKPLSYVAHGLTGLLDGQGHAFKNIKIEKDGSGQANHYGVGLVGALSAGGTIQNLGLTGTVTNTSTNAATKTAAFCGGKHNGGGGYIKNCWADVHVKGPSGAENGTLAVFFAYPQDEMVLENCINYGTVESTSVNGGAAVFSPYNRITVKNCLDLGTIIAKGSGNAGAFNNHTNSLSYVFNNNWSVNTLWASSRAFDANSVGTLTLPNGDPITSADDVNNYFAVSSAKEAAYNATNGANGAVYYTVNEEGKVVYGSADNHLYKIAITGDDNLVGYYLAGETVDLIADLGLKEGIDSLTGYDYTADYKLTMPAEDLTLTVAYGDEAALDTAKVELNALIADYAKYDLNLLENSTIGSWLEAANALLAREDVALDELNAQIEAADAIAIGTLKADAKVPYGKKALYADLMAADNTVFGIYEKTDWLKLVEDFSGKACSLTLYVMDNIDFEETPMLPLSYTASSGLNGGRIYGQGHTFENINIVGTDTTNWRCGIALVSAANGNVVIDSLGLTGKVTNTATAATWMDGSTSRNHYTAAFIAGKHNNEASNIVISNCWADVHVKGPSDNNGGVAVFLAYPTAQHSIINCINYGTVESTTNGKVGVFMNGHSINPGLMKNNIDNGTIITSGVKAAFLAHGNMNLTTSTNNWSVNDTYNFRDGKANTAVLLPDGTTAEANLTNAQVSEIYKIVSAEETAYVATANAGGDVIFTVKDGKVAYGTATDRVQKIAFVGDVEIAKYLKAGATLDLSEISTDDATVFTVTTEGYENAIADGILTVPNADITINVVGEVIDLGAYNAAKAALEALSAKYGALRADLFTNGAAIADAKAAIDAALAADAESTDDTKQAIIDLAATVEVDLTLKADAKVPYGTKALYADLMAEGNKDFGIYEKTDWLKLVDDYATTSCSLNIYVMDDIYFNNEPMRPLGYVANGMIGLLDGQGHTFYDININMQGAVANHYGVALVGSLSAGGTIQNLTLTGNVTNTSTDPAALTAAFAAGKNNGANAAGVGSAIINCRSDVHVKGPSKTTAGDTGNGLAAFRPYVQVNDKIINCINNGIVESTTTGGTVATFTPYRGARPTIENCVDNGTLTTTGVKAAILTNGGWGDATAANNWAVNHDAWWFNKAINPAITLPNGETASTVEEVNAYYTVGSAYEAAYKATAGANGEVFYTVEDGKVAFAEAKSIFKVEFTEDVLAAFYLNNGATITLSEVCDVAGATFTVTTEGYENAIVDGILTVPNADITVEVITPDCKHTGEFRFEHIAGGETHNKICVACGEVVEVLPCVPGAAIENEPVVDGENITFTHSSFCNDCEFEYKEDCEKTLVPNTFDCTEDSKYTFTCGREDYTLVDSGNEDHTWGDWTTEGATPGYKRHDCENCDQFEEELLPLAAPVIIIEAKEDKAGATGVGFSVKLTEAGVKAGTITITLPEWAENVSIVAGENVTVDGLVATITGNIAAGSVLLTGTYDIDHLAGENGVITATATNVLNEREEAVEVAVATADATIDVILGDAHVDGVINIIDALAVLRNSVGKDADVNRANADVNADGDVNINDAIWIVRWWLGDEDGPALGV